MDVPQEISKLQQDARSMSRAAHYMKQAAVELKPVVVPMATDALSRAGSLAGKSVNKLRAIAPDTLKRNTAVAVGAAALVAVGLTAATVGHVAHHRRAIRDRKMREAAERVAQARQAEIEEAIDQAQEHFRAQDYKALYDQADSDSMIGLNEPGCFVILAFDPDPQDGDFSAFSDVYVGASEDMSEGAYRQLSGKGNLYVHADAVYHQPQYVLFYPCEAHELYSYREKLISALGADVSYNRVSDLADLD